RSTSHGANYVVGQAPAELFGDFESDSLGSFRVVRTQIHVHKSPTMFVGDLRAEAVDLSVVSTDAHNLRSENVRAENLCRLEVGRNEDPRFQAFACSVRSNGVGQVSRRGARDGVEAKSTSLGEGYGDNTIFEAQRRKTDCVVLDVQIACGSSAAQLSRQLRRVEQRRETNRQTRGEALGGGQQFGVAPHVRCPLRDALATERSLGNLRFQSVVVVSNFEGGETVVADGAGLVSP